MVLDNFEEQEMKVLYELVEAENNMAIFENFSIIMRKAKVDTIKAQLQ